MNSTSHRHDRYAMFAADAAIVEKNYAWVSADATVGEAFSHLYRTGSTGLETNPIRGILVLQQGRPVGILTERDIVRLTALGKHAQALPVAAVMTRNFVTVSQQQTENLFEVLALFQNEAIQQAIVLDEQEIVAGLVTVESLRRGLSANCVTVADAMSPVHCQAYPHISLVEVAHLMMTHRCDSVVIVEGHPTDDTLLIPLGIITGRDIVQHQRPGFDLHQSLVGELVRRPLLVAHPDDTLVAAHALMHRHNIEHLLVVGERGELLGLLSQPGGLAALLPGATSALVASLLVERERLIEHPLQLHREQQARQAAEQANCQKDEFLAALSHELRTPLNPILGFTQLLLRGKLSAECRQALEIIERNGKLQRRLIEDLQDLSRILRGKLELRTVTVDLLLVVQAALETIQSEAEARRVQIELVVRERPGLVRIDIVRLQQVIWNLLSNAIKFSTEGANVRLTVGTWREGIELMVEDHGCGIDPAFLPHVFERFRQASSTSMGTGLGLGLAIVRHLVELHGGTVTAASDGPGQGATFTVRLPRIC